MKTVNFLFEVETVESGQRRSYGDSYYSYNVTSDRPEREVKSFCMNVLNKSFNPAEMPNPFAGKLLEFKKITDNNKDKSLFDKKECETYSYKLSNEYTG